MTATIESWRYRAKCGSATGDEQAVFTSEAPSAQVDHLIAAYCHRCPVIEACGIAGREGREWGIWGGEVLDRGRPARRPGPPPQKTTSKPPGPDEQVVTWLAHELADGPVDADVIRQAAKDEGIAAVAVRRAFTALGLQARTRYPKRARVTLWATSPQEATRLAALRDWLAHELAGNTRSRLDLLSIVPANLDASVREVERATEALGVVVDRAGRQAVLWSLPREASGQRRQPKRVSRSRRRRAA